MSGNKNGLKIYDAMSYPVVSAKTTDEIKTIAVKMKKADVGSIIILGKTRKPVGIITQGDIMRMMATKPKGALYTMRAGQMMSKPLRTIEGNKKLEEAARSLVKNKIKRLGVVKDGKLVGIITDNDIMKNALYLIDVGNFVDLVGEMVHTYRMD